MIDRKDVINWSVKYENGRETIGHATIRQIRQNVQPVLTVVSWKLFITLFVLDWLRHIVLKEMDASGGR